MKNIPWWEPSTGEREIELLAEVVAANYLNEGGVTERFEREVARLLGVKHAVGATSGTAALFLSLAGLGIGPGDEVIVPDLTFVATANAVRLAGAVPVLVDIDPRTLNIDPCGILRALTPKTKAIIPVHVSGRPADMSVILTLARDRGLFVVEDAAEGFMSRAGEKFLGTIGDMGCLSFSPAKIITTGQGGMVMCHDDDLAVRLRELKDQGRPTRGTGGDDLHVSIGYNFKLTNLQSCVGLAQLERLRARMNRMRRNHELYCDLLAGVPQVLLLPFNIAGGELPLWTDALIEDRDGLDAFLTGKGIHCRRFWFPIHCQAPYRLPNDAFPASTSCSRRALWLPSAFTLTDDDVREVCDRIREYFET